MNHRLSRRLFGYFAQSARALFLSRGSFARGFSRLSRGSLSIFGSLSLRFSREVEKESKKAAFGECECNIFLLFPLFLYQKTNLKTFIFRKTNRVGARVVRHRRKVGREIRRGHEGCHRASSRSFGLPDGRRRERTVHRKDESVDERVGREVQKIWGLFR